MVLKGPATEALDRLTKRCCTMDTMACSKKLTENFSSFLKMEAASQRLATNRDCMEPPFNICALFDAIQAADLNSEGAFPIIEWRFDDDENEEIEAFGTATH